MGRRKQPPSIALSAVAAGAWIERTNDQRDGRPPVNAVDLLVVVDVTVTGVTVRKWLGTWELGQPVLGRLSGLEDRTLAGKRYRLLPESEQPKPPVKSGGGMVSQADLNEVGETLVFTTVDPTSPLHAFAIEVGRGFNAVLAGQRRIEERLDRLAAMFPTPALPTGQLSLSAVNSTGLHR